MQGITILNETTKLPDGYAGIIVILIILSIGMIVLGYCCIRYNEHTWSKIIAGMVCCIILIGCVVGVVILTNQEQTYYKVLLDDNITFVEFNEQYQIIEQEGLILTVIKR
jgi:ABC-type uncharacterized transport system permease subunit